MRYLTFVNKGLLDVLNIMLMGVSSKRDQPGLIGQYGSGWKYAIAILLRNEIPFQIYSGKSHLQIITKPVTMRDKRHDVVYVNDLSAMYSTELGPDWQVWMALREIYCNSIDEGSYAIQIVEDDEMKSMIHQNYNRTLIAVQITEEIQSVIDNWMDYFSFDRTDDIMNSKGVKVFTKRNKTKSIIYRRGIKVAESKKAGCYDYDFDNITINEIREAVNFGEIEELLKKVLQNNVTSEIVRTILASKDTWEKEIHFYPWEAIAYNMHPVWKEAIGQHAVVPTEFREQLQDKENDDEEKILSVPATLAKIISLNIEDVTVRGFGNSDIIVLPADMTEEDHTVLEHAFSLLDISDVDYTKAGLVKVVNFGSPNVDSIKSSDGIYIAHRLLRVQENISYNDTSPVFLTAVAIFKQIYIMQNDAAELSVKLEGKLFSDLLAMLYNDA